MLDHIQLLSRHALHLQPKHSNAAHENWQVRKADQGKLRAEAQRVHNASDARSDCKDQVCDFLANRRLHGFKHFTYLGGQLLDVTLLEKGNLLSHQRIDIALSQVCDNILCQMLPEGVENVRENEHRHCNQNDIRDDKRHVRDHIAALF